MTFEGEVAGVNWKLTAEETGDKRNLFSPQHVKYACTLEGNGKTLAFPYQANPRCSEVDLKQVLECLSTDASCYEAAPTVEDFLIEFGYTGDPASVGEGAAAFKSCQATAEFFQSFGKDFATEELSRALELEGEEVLEK